MGDPAYMAIHCIFPTFAEIPKYCRSMVKSNCKIYCSGTGKNILNTIDSIKHNDKQPIILVLGYAGATNPQFSRGDVIVCNQYNALNKPTLFPNKRILDFVTNLLLEHNIVYYTATSFTSNNVVSTSIQKKECYERKNDIVEMENYYAVERANDYNIPCVCIRFILDTAQDTLPDMSSTLKNNGLISPWHTACYILRNPFRIFTMLKILGFTKIVSPNITKVIQTIENSIFP